MNVVTRGIKNAFRSPMKSVAIILMLAISIGLILSMLVARSSIEAKIADVKSTSGTGVTVNPAGVQGFAGGGDLLTTDNLTTIENTDHVSSVVASLSDQMSTDDTDLESSQEMGSFGARQERLSDSSSSSSTSDSSDSSPTSVESMSARITITGTTDPNSVSTNGSDLDITSGETFDGSSDDLVALVGSDLADENDLEVGDTFTVYDNTITVVGIYTTDNSFQDSGLIMPLATIQNITDQSDSISSVGVTVDSVDNVETVVSSLESSLGDSADITSEIEQAQSSAESLEGISSLALAGIIGSTIAGAVIVLLAMIMIVRERRREIGVVKAIGGSNTKIIGQFITEALCLTLIGAVIGFTLGLLVSGPMTTSLVSNSSSSSSSKSSNMPSGSAPSSSSSSESSSSGPGQMMQKGMEQIGSNFTQITSSVTPQVFIIAGGITILIAILGSAVPAWLIARVRPAEVLRTE